MHKAIVYLEIGKKRTFASAVEWPGWCRSGGDESTALEAMVRYGPRYAQVMGITGIAFTIPETISSLTIAERLTGNATTDYGAPGCIPKADRRAMRPEELGRSRQMLRACWEHFDRAVGRAAGVPLRKGPRGGGRDLDKILGHVLESDRAYLARIAWKKKQAERLQAQEAFKLTRQAILEALDVAFHEGLPEHGPRGGLIWPVHYFIRRTAWHILDHAWEIEDRLVPQTPEV